MNHYRSLLLAFLLLFILGCDQDLEMNSVKTTIYLPQYGLTTHAPLIGNSLFRLELYKAGFLESPGVTVQVQVDAAAFNRFKQDNPSYSDYELLPSMYYSMESLKVTIPQGAYSKPLIIRFKNIDESYVNKKYILPISIKSVSGGQLNGGKSVAFLHFNQYRNVYDGTYLATGTCIGVFGDRLGLYTNKRLVTAGSKSITTTIGHYSASTSSMLLTVLENGQVSIQSAPGSERREVQNDPTKVSTYSGSFDTFYQRNTGVFKLYYQYVDEMGERFNVEEELKFWL